MNFNRLMMRLVRQLARRGLREYGRSTRRRPAKVQAAAAAPVAAPTQMQLHLFGANFDSRADAERFCYAPAQDGAPALAQEFPTATLDLAEVEVVQGGIEARLQEFLTASEADDILLRLGGDNTLILMTEHAFFGAVPRLDDTDRLTYLGPLMVNV